MVETGEKRSSASESLHLVQIPSTVTTFTTYRELRITPEVESSILDVSPLSVASKSDLVTEPDILKTGSSLVDLLATNKNTKCLKFCSQILN